MNRARAAYCVPGVPQVRCVVLCVHVLFCCCRPRFLLTSVMPSPTLHLPPGPARVTMGHGCIWVSATHPRGALLADVALSTRGGMGLGASARKLEHRERVRPAAGQARPPPVVRGHTRAGAQRAGDDRGWYPCPRATAGGSSARRGTEEQGHARAVFLCVCGAVGVDPRTGAVRAGREWGGENMVEYSFYDMHGSSSTPGSQAAGTKNTISAPP